MNILAASLRIIINYRTGIFKSGLVGGKGLEPEEYQLKKQKLLNEKLDTQPKINDFTKSENWRCFLDEVRTFFEQNSE